MGKIEKFEDIIAWQRARELNKLIYKFTLKKPFALDFELVKQIRRSSISILSNIAEGFERRGIREFLHFLNISKASAAELRAQIYVAFDLEYLTKEEADALLEKVISISKMVSGLMNYLCAKEEQGFAFHESAGEYNSPDLPTKLFNFQTFQPSN